MNTVKENNALSNNNLEPVELATAATAGRGPWKPLHHCPRLLQDLGDPADFPEVLTITFSLASLYLFRLRFFLLLLLRVHFNWSFISSNVC